MEPSNTIMLDKSTPMSLSERASQASGQPIGPLMAQALANPGLISLAAGFVDAQTLPVELMKSAAAQVFGQTDVAQQALQYGTTHGSNHLREIILDRLQQADGSNYSNLGGEQVYLTSGSNQLLHLVGEAVLDPGDIVLCCAPTYLVFIGTVANLGGVCHSVESDEQGMIPESLDATLEKLAAENQLHRVKLLYLVSYSDNPHGITMPDSRRDKIAAVFANWRERQAMLLIDDIAYRELRFTDEDPKSFLSYESIQEHVIVAGTYSKSFSPGLRIGWGVVPKSLVHPIHDLKGNFDFGSPHMNQVLLATIHDSGQYDAHVAKLCLAYQEKRDAMLAALEVAFGDQPEIHWTTPSGGLYIWLELPEPIDTGSAGRLFDLSRENGMLYVPGEYCFPAQGVPPKKNCMRLSYGVQSCENIVLGIQSLAKAIQQL